MLSEVEENLSKSLSDADDILSDAVQVTGSRLTLDRVYQVTQGKTVRFDECSEVLKRLEASCDFVDRAVSEGQHIYGVTTSFGGMSDRAIEPERAAALQAMLPLSHKAGFGDLLPIDDVRATLLIRSNALLQGASGIRYELVKRLEVFLNESVTPVIHEHGSIGASGDLVPLSYVLGALAGLNRSYEVDFRGKRTDCISALNALGLEPISLRPKESLAIMNGTSASAGIACNATIRFEGLCGILLAVHAMIGQALCYSTEALDPFIHERKPHSGQLRTARLMRSLLSGSSMTQDPDHTRLGRNDDLIQDRYSLRCLPQFIGPTFEWIEFFKQQLETEINAVTDNPLIDASSNQCFHGGNFLGQHIAVGMDQLRYHIGLVAKHLDAQIALLVSPAFNHGLPPSLVGNPSNSLNVGLKALQIGGNSMMPLLSFYGNSLADRFPTHAEQFNQNINSQSFGSANLARRSSEYFRQYLAIGCIFAVQSVDLRTQLIRGHYDARSVLSDKMIPFYEMLYACLGKKIDERRPLVWNDDEQSFDVYVMALSQALADGEPLFEQGRSWMGSQ